VDREVAVQYLSEILSFVAGLVGGSLLTIKYYGKRAGGKLIDQSGAKAQGDVIGGNKSTVNTTERK
jgi:hypothetical protein